MLITPQDQDVIVQRALGQIGAALRERGLTLEELIEAGREERNRLIEEQYGLGSTDEG